MRLLLQVCKECQIEINSKIVSSIERGFLLFVGFTQGDDFSIIKKVIDKALSLRLFPDQEGKINLPLDKEQDQVMIVSQFTLYADCKKGRRPSFVKAINNVEGRELYSKTVDYIKNLGYRFQTGVFQEDMKVHLINDGPTTIILDSEDL